ncbi:MAG TPA: hypothetical protein VIH59_29010 [Candidatus Tectomicrobia bacterium]|jgi:hypothetical protein
MSSDPVWRQGVQAWEMPPAQAWSQTVAAFVRNLLRKTLENKLALSQRAAATAAMNLVRQRDVSRPSEKPPGVA